MSFLCLRAVGMVVDEEMLQLKLELQSHFDVPIDILDPLPDPAFAFDPARNQYNSALVLRGVIDASPRDAWRLLAVTGRDLFIPMLSFVFGQAQLGGKAALVSYARLRQEFYGLPPARATFAERARKEVLHELGHTFGLVHCPDARCPMSLSTGIAQVDRKTHLYCEACAAQLRASRIPLLQPEKMS